MHVYFGPTHHRQSLGLSEISFPLLLVFPMVGRYHGPYPCPSPPGFIGLLALPAFYFSQELSLALGLQETRPRSRW